MRAMRWTPTAGVVASCVLSAASARADAEAVAVFDIDARNVQGFNESMLSTFTDLLDGVVANSGYRTVPRSQLKEQLSQQTADSFNACYDESCQIELGKAVAAQKAVTSVWARLGDTCVLTIRLFDLRTELTEFSTKSNAECSQSGLRKGIEEVGSALRARVQSVGTFGLDLKAGQEIKNPPTDKSGYLKVNVHPKGRLDEKVEIYINGSLAGTTNHGFFTKELPAGRYVVLLRTPGDLFRHQRIEVRMTPSGVRIPKNGSVELERLFGYLLVTGVPSIATVVINGEPKPTSGRPLRLERRLGEHTVVVEAAGYLPSDPRTVTVSPGRETPVSYDLVRNAGELNVGGAPPGAEVKVDGVRVGTLPVIVSELDVGDHIVEISETGFHTEKKVVSVKRGETVSLDEKLREKKARLRIESWVHITGEKSQIETDVYLDGIKVGKTPWKKEVRAEVEHRIVLGLGSSARTSEERISLSEGAVRKKEIVVPSRWGGAVSSLGFDLVDGPWEIRSGRASFELNSENPVRPGELPIQFFLGGKEVGRAQLIVEVDDKKLIRVTGRPLTDDEFRTRESAQSWRRWLTLGAAIAAGGVGGGFMISARAAASDRDEAYQALSAGAASGDYDGLRRRVVDGQENAEVAQTLALGALASGAVMLVWSAVEWLSGPPDRGVIVGDDVVTPMDEGDAR